MVLDTDVIAAIRLKLSLAASAIIVAEHNVRVCGSRFLHRVDNGAAIEVIRGDLVNQNLVEFNEMRSHISVLGQKVSWVESAG